MDTFHLGRLIGEIESRLLVIETEWELVRRYGKRAILLLALAALNFVGHLDAQEVAALLKNSLSLAAQIFG